MMKIDSQTLLKGVMASNQQLLVALFYEVHRKILLKGVDCCMPKPQVNEKVVQEQHEEEEFKGTFVSVLLLGGFLVVTWVGVLILYLIR